jgi:hypothetical protein
MSVGATTATQDTAKKAVNPTDNGLSAKPSVDQDQEANNINNKSKANIKVGLQSFYKFKG